MALINLGTYLNCKKRRIHSKETLQNYLLTTNNSNLKLQYNLSDTSIRNKRDVIKIVLH